MRLLNTSTFMIEEVGDPTQPYAILSHTWDRDGEITFQLMAREGEYAASSKGYDKVKKFCSVAIDAGYSHVWIDTCCIDKTSSSELSEAINSMYHWYQLARVCYAYLADVSSGSEISGSRWFTRGWTLQELIAPLEVKFLNKEWEEIGTRSSLQQVISEKTGIPDSILLGGDLEDISAAQRMSWAAERHTTRVEDRAYCLIGLFNINMPLLYGEGERAFLRLQEEVLRVSDDHSLFAWRSSDNRGGLLATSPAAFIHSRDIVQFNPFGMTNGPLTISNKGVHLELRFIAIGPRGLGLAILHCKENQRGDSVIAIHVRDIFLTMEYFERVQSDEFRLVRLDDLSSLRYTVQKICIRKGRIVHMRRSEDVGSIISEIHPDGELAHRRYFAGREGLFRAVEEGCEDAVWMLLAQGDVEINVQNADKQTPISLAAREGKIAVVRMLLGRRGIEPDSKDLLGRTPLSWAAGKGQLVVVSLLLNSGYIDAEGKNRYAGRTPLSYAAEGGHKAVVRLLLDKGANVELKGFDGLTPLSYAAKGGHKAVVRLLLDKGVEVDSITTSGIPMLFEKASMGYILTKAWTPLFFATWEEHESIVKLLLHRGANVNVKDDEGRTPLYLATWKNHEAIVQLLERAGALG